MNRVGRLAVAVMAGLVLACQTTYYDEYRAAHPDWEARLPQEGERLEEVLAAIFAPSRFEELKVTVTGLTIRVANEDPWRPVDFEELRGGRFASDDAETYVVFAERVCAATVGVDTRFNDQGSYYLLFDNRLLAWDHYAFRPGCITENRFRAVRPERAEIENLALREFAARHPITHLGVTDIYRRGLAYVEAGRYEDAYGMLTLGDAGLARLKRRPELSEMEAATSIDERVEAERLREKLRRALGLPSEEELGRRRSASPRERRR